MSKEERDELIHSIAKRNTENVDFKTLMQCYYEDQLDWFRSLDDDELLNEVS